MKKAAAILLGLIFLIFSAAACFLLEMSIWSDQKAIDGGEPRIFHVAPGQGFQSITRGLREAGFLKNGFKFRTLARLKGDDKRIKAGEYLLSPPLSPNELLALLTEGKVRLHRLTVPEGYNLRQIAYLVEQGGFGSAGAFLQKASDPGLLTEIGINGSSFEGYLYPETYSFSGDATAGRIIRTMVRRFRTVFTEEWHKRAAILGFSIHQIVTLASIIEKETGVESERPVISSVFHNRLKRRMRLETDPTVIYGIPDFNGNLTRKDLETLTPYNTYKIRGLPPGPIASPGYDSLHAALYPARTRFIYFVAKKDRTHHFSATFREHNRAVRKYQLRK